MAQLSIRDPNCLHVTLRGYTLEAARNLANGALNIPVNGVNDFGVFNPNLTVSIQGIFQEDGASVSIESTNDEDEFQEAVDGSICVYPKSNENRIVTLNLNSCNSAVEEIIALKAFRYSTTGSRAVIRVPFYFELCDYCTGFTLIADCAWIISNPTLNLGADDSGTEVRILLASPRDNTLVFSDRFAQRSSEVNAGINGNINIGIN